VGEVVATIAVGVGIVLETPENPTPRQKFAIGLVVLGVFAETVCSVWLFTHDAGIIQSQQKEILALVGSNKKLDEALRRQRDRIAAADNDLDDISDRADALEDSLDDLGSEVRDLKASEFTLGTRQRRAERALSTLDSKEQAVAGSLLTVQGGLTQARGEIDDLFQRTRRRHLVDGRAFGRFPQSKAFIWVVPHDDEAEAFASELSDALKDAHWIVAPVTADKRTVEREFWDPEGVLISFNGERKPTGTFDQQTHDRATLVCRVLQANQIPGIRTDSDTTGYKEAGNGDLVIWIGSRSERSLNRHEWAKKYPDHPWPFDPRPEVAKLELQSCSSPP